MNKTEPISAMAEKTAISKKDADDVMNAVADVVIKATAKEKRIQLVGFGTLEARSRNGRQGRDSRANSPITIPASKIPALKAGKILKDAIDK